jgi:hypothetical protein
MLPICGNCVGSASVYPLCRNAGPGQHFAPIVLQSLRPYAPGDALPGALSKALPKAFPIALPTAPLAGPSLSIATDATVVGPEARTTRHFEIPDTYRSRFERGTSSVETENRVHIACLGSYRDKKTCILRISGEETCVAAAFEVLNKVGLLP